MRDALGGTVNIAIIVIFIVFALGYLAYNVNYTKAFRMKDKIITVYEKYKGVCPNDTCGKEIDEYAQSIGYEPEKFECFGNEIADPYGNYCIKPVQVTDVDDMKTRCYYHVVTKINISIPILENILNIEGTDPNNPGRRGISVFYVTGDTKTIERAEGDSCGKAAEVK